ncbi:MAG: phosphatidylserine decarboxylase [Thermoplasmata archaeon]|nr:phosphatidylserine decarboxylase [Thermoplasmata archaeon]
MFAPGSGRYLLVGAAILVLGGFAIGVGWIHSLLSITGFVVALALWAFLAGFFRDPERAVGDGIVSAADGRVLLVGAEGDRWQIAVFMSVTNVHVNRFPMAATVAAITPSGQGYRLAYDRDAHHNVRLHYRLDTAIGPVEVVAMTGIVARRLVPLVAVGDARAKGDRLGMIVLGSRVDVFLPKDRIVPLVVPGQQVRAGVTPIAREAA